MEDIRPYRIRNEENDRRNDESDNRVEWEVVRLERRQAEDDMPFDIPRD